MVRAISKERLVGLWEDLRYCEWLIVSSVQGGRVNAYPVDYMQHDCSGEPRISGSEVARRYQERPSLAALAADIEEMRLQSMEKRNTSKRHSGVKAPVGEVSFSKAMKALFDLKEQMAVDGDTYLCVKAVPGGQRVWASKTEPDLPTVSYRIADKEDISAGDVHQELQRMAEVARVATYQHRADRKASAA